VRALSHVLFFSTLVRCGEYQSQTGIQRKLNFVSVRTIKEGSSWEALLTVFPLKHKRMQTVLLAREIGRLIAWDGDSC
jgi:hypothetical protein